MLDMIKTDDTRIISMQEIISPEQLHQQLHQQHQRRLVQLYVLSEGVRGTVHEHFNQLHKS